MIVGISIPILMIILVAASIYLPGFFIKPQYNFLYVNGDDSYYNERHQYSVQDGKLIRNEMKDSEGKAYTYARLFLYDVIKDKSREVTFEEAQNLGIDPSDVSPDGFEIAYGSHGSGIFPFFFYSNTDYNTRYLTGHNISKKLNLQLIGSYYNSFRFIGWINQTYGK